MPLKLRDHPTPTPPPDVEAELAAFRAQWKVVKQHARHLSTCAEEVVALDGEADYGKSAYAYTRHFCETWLAVQELIALAAALSPEARARVEAGVGRLFEDDGALTPLWRNLWLGPEVAEAARVRRLASTKKL